MFIGYKLFGRLLEKPTPLFFSLNLKEKRRLTMSSTVLLFSIPTPSEIPIKHFKTNIKEASINEERCRDSLSCKNPPHKLFSINYKTQNSNREYQSCTDFSQHILELSLRRTSQ